MNITVIESIKGLLHELTFTNVLLSCLLILVVSFGYVFSRSSKFRDWVMSMDLKSHSVHVRTLDRKVINSIDSLMQEIVDKTSARLVTLSFYDPKSELPKTATRVISYKSSFEITSTLNSAIMLDTPQAVGSIYDQLQKVAVLQISTTSNIDRVNQVINAIDKDIDMGTYFAMYISQGKSSIVEGNLAVYGKALNPEEYKLITETIFPQLRFLLIE
jgi:uncharacterized membrane protein YheB (UPF0754 family)